MKHRELIATNPPSKTSPITIDSFSTLRATKYRERERKNLRCSAGEMQNGLERRGVNGFYDGSDATLRHSSLPTPFVPLYRFKLTPSHAMSFLSNDNTHAHVTPF